MTLSDAIGALQRAATQLGFGDGKQLWFVMFVIARAMPKERPTVPEALRATCQGAYPRSGSPKALMALAAGLGIPSQEVKTFAFSQGKFFVNR